MRGHETDANLPWFVSSKGMEALQRASSYLVVDLETTNLTNGLPVDPDNELLLACWSVVRDGKETKRFKFADEFDQDELLEDIASVDFTVAHNAKFELGWLHRCGLDLRSILVYDTMSSEWVIQGNRRVPYNLDDTAKRYGLGQKKSLVAKLIHKGVNPKDIPRSWLLPYCMQDVDLCHAVMNAQRPILDERKLWHLVLQRSLVIPALTDVELQGLTLDKERVLSEKDKLTQIVEELGAQLDDITGGINLGSPKQLRKLLYEDLEFPTPLDNGGRPILTGSQEPSTAVTALAKLEATTPIQEEFLRLYKEYNKASTLLSKNINFFQKVCEEKNGVFYGQFNHCRTANHRLSSSGIKSKFKDGTELAAQLQNLPRQYKNLFTVSDPDYEVTEYDGSQIEFRVAADLGHDNKAETDIVEGVDIHSRTRDTMNAAYKRFGIRKEIDRQGAKPQTFAPMYFGQGKDKAEQEYAQAWRKIYPDLFQTQSNWTLTVADRGELTTDYGLTFYWPNAKMHRSGYVSFSTEIFNLPISGFATGEIIPIALVHFWHRIKHTNARVFNTVHDSIIVYNKKDEIDYVTEIAKESMTHDVYNFLNEVYGYKFTVPLGFGCKTGDHWGESSEEKKWDVWPDGDERLQIEKDKKLTVIYDTRKENKVKNESFH